MSSTPQGKRADEAPVEAAGRTSPNELASRTAPEAAGRVRPGLRCLITNDDGVNSDGLRTLAAVAVDAGLDVLVAAPLENCSGASSSISAVEAGGRFVVERRQWPGFDDIEVFGVDGLPAFIALTAARGAFGEPPDIVLSGVNRGPNTGYAILHSGTVGAALTASTHGCRAMAVSLNAVAPSEPHWKSAGDVAATVLSWLLEAPPGAVFNVNVPDVEPAAVRGLEWAELAHFGAVQVNIAEQGEGYFELSLSDLNAEYEPGTDAAFLADGFATVTALNPVCAARPAHPSGGR
jgi:5'-nucleotidase